MDQNQTVNTTSHELEQPIEIDSSVEGATAKIKKLLFKRPSRKEIFFLVSILSLIAMTGIVGYLVYQGRTISPKIREEVPPPPKTTVIPTEILPTPTPTPTPISTPNAISTSTPTPKPVVTSTPEPTVEPIIGEQKTLVIMFNFQDQPNNKPFSREYVYSTFFTGTKSLNSYYKEISFNQLWFTGEVVGWYTIPYNTSCSWDEQMRQILLDKVEANGVNVNDYSHLIYLKPYMGCSPTATIGGNPSEIYLAGTIDLSTLIHEMGHNLTLGYAASLSCGNKAIDSYSNCLVDYYGDLFSPQGAATTFHHNAFHKLSLGWIPSSRIQEVTTSGNYTIYPIEMVKTGIQVLKIRKPDTNEYYFLEYRRPIGFDSNLPQKATFGALLHVGFQSDSPITPYFKLLDCSEFKMDTYLIDTHPETQNDFSDAALANGTLFYDVINNITITQLRQDKTSVTVSVKLPTSTPSP